MKINLDFTKEDRVEETRKKQQVQEQERVLVNSVEPKPNHLLFEFHQEEDGFKILQTEWKQPKEIVFVNINGKFIEKKEEAKKTFIDIFNPNFKAEKQKHEIELKEGVCYVTALNYENAVKKFKALNPSFF